jgi:dihydroorotase
LGATNDNLAEVAKINPKEVCGVKLFMGSSTGNMLVDQTEALERLFKEAPCLIAAHCEEESIIKQNTQLYKELSEKGEIKADATIHPLVRSAEACYQSSAKAVELAERTGARLHIMHISTAKELSLFRNDISIENKKITAETCPHYLFFNDKNYVDKGFAIKCNPAIKSATDQQALQQALTSGLIDTIGTDHAPHLREEKFTGDYFSSKSGFPSVQNSLNIMLMLYKQDKVTLPQIVNLTAHHPALLYQIDRRGFIREGYYADMAIVNLNTTQTIRNEEMHYKCGWTPYNGTTVHSHVTHTFVNGNLVYENGEFHEDQRGFKLAFKR